MYPASRKIGHFKGFKWPKKGLRLPKASLVVIFGFLIGLAIDVQIMWGKSSN
jgi:hypothetical protein